MEEGFVEAIDEGRIVKVPEDYARQEGMPIIRRPEPAQERVESQDRITSTPNMRAKRGILSFEEFRRPLKSMNQVEKELKANFHWDVVRKRKALGLSRKQFAEKLSVPEHDIMMFERGVLLKDDFILINKVQDFLGVNLRKDGQDFSKSPREQVREKDFENPIEDNRVSGSEIELED